MTSDQHVVLWHDWMPSIKSALRPTGVCSLRRPLLPQPLHEVPLHELLQDYGYEHAGQRLPLLTFTEFVQRWARMTASGSQRMCKDCHTGPSPRRIHQLRRKDCHAPETQGPRGGRGAGEACRASSATVCGTQSSGQTVSLNSRGEGRVNSLHWATRSRPPRRRAGQPRPWLHHDSPAVLALSHQDASLNLRRLSALCEVARTIPSRRPRAADPGGMKLAERCSQARGGPAATRSASDAASWSTAFSRREMPSWGGGVLPASAPERGKALAGGGRKRTPGGHHPQEKQGALRCNSKKL